MLFTNAEEDQWANPAGQFEVLKAATRRTSCTASRGWRRRCRPSGKLIDSRLGYFIRPGKHAMTPDDWKVFLDYGDKWLK